MTKNKSKTQSRRLDQLRPITIKRKFTNVAPGSVLIKMGNTHVLCTASIDTELPKWRKDSGLGWLTTEYTMHPASTSPRKPRPRTGHTDGRGTEIQRLIGRALRCTLDFEKLGPNIISIDCEVLQADGGTRTAAINGSFIALVDAIRYGIKNKLIQHNPIIHAVAAVSVGIVNDKAVLDLDYQLDVNAQVDMNIAMTDDNQFVEVQGTGEHDTFNDDQLRQMLDLAKKGIKQIFALQQKHTKL